MSRSCMFFLGLILWGNARGGRVLTEQSAQNGQSDREDTETLHGPASLSPEQQLDSGVASGVQSFDSGAANNDAGSSNRRSTRLARLIPNIQGASSSREKLNVVSQNDASGPVYALAPGSGAGGVNVPGFPKPSGSSQAKNDQTAPAGRPFKCAFPRRRNPSSRVRVPFKPPSPTNQIVYGSQGSLGSTKDSLASQRDYYEVKPSGYADGFASTRLSSQTSSPLTLPTQYDPAFQASWASNIVAPSQSLGIAPVPSQQGGSSFQSRWIGIQSGAGTSTQTQASSVLAPFKSLRSESLPSQQDGATSQSRWSASRAQSIPAASGSTLQTQPSNVLDLYRGLGAAPVKSQQDGFNAQPSWSTSQVQSLAVTQPMLQTQAANLLKPFQTLGIAPLPSQQDIPSSSFQSRWSASQAQNFPSTAGSTFQTQASNLVAPSQSLGTAPLPSQKALQRQNLAAPQTQASDLLGTSRNLATAPVPSKQDGFNAPSSWSASWGQSVTATQPMPQTQASNLVAPSQSLPSASLSSLQEGDGLLSSWYSTPGQSTPLATGPKLQTPTMVSNILGPSQSSPVPAPEQGGYGFQSSWYSTRGQSIPLATGPKLQTPTTVANLFTSTQTRSESDLASQAQFGYRAQSSGTSMSRDVGSSSLYTSAQSQDVQLSPFEALIQSPGVFPSQGAASLYDSPLQSQSRPDSLGAHWYLVSSDGLMALQRESLGGLYNPAASIRFHPGRFVVPQSQSALAQGGVQPPATQSNSKSFTSSQNDDSPLASVAQSSMTKRTRPSVSSSSLGLISAEAVASVASRRKIPSAARTV